MVNPITPLTSFVDERQGDTWAVVEIPPHQLPLTVKTGLATQSEAIKEAIRMSMQMKDGFRPLESIRAHAERAASQPQQPAAKRGWRAWFGL